MLRFLALPCVLLLVHDGAAATGCWSQAAEQYGVSAELLYAVARAESNLNSSAVNLSHKARTGTYDIGLMQINSSHLRRLAAAGIREQDLYDPCTNIRVGAWLMAHSFARHGVSWNAVGAYNAACSQLKGDACTAARAKYSWRVYQRLPSANATANRQAPLVRATTSPPPVFVLSAKVSP